MPLRDFKCNVSPDFLRKAPSQAPVYIFDCFLFIKRLQGHKVLDPCDWDGHRGEREGRRNMSGRSQEPWALAPHFDVN